MKIKKICTIITIVCLIFNVARSFAEKGTLNNVEVPQAFNSQQLLHNSKIKHRPLVKDEVIDLEIYKLEVGNLNIPIRLTYNTRGIKVNDLSSAVGLGWALHVGGGVYRDINGLADDEANGWLNDSNQNHSPSSISNINTSSPTSTERDVLKDLAFNKFDTQPDLFEYAFLNNIGNFLFQKNSTSVSYLNKGTTTIQATSQSCSLPTDITSSFMSAYSGLDYSFDDASNKIISFVGYDKKGNKFTFSDIESAKVYTKNGTNGNTTRFDPTDNLEPTQYGLGSTAWLLSKIETYDGHVVDYTYETYEVSIVDSVVTKETVDSPSGCSSFSTKAKYTTTNNKLITEIKIDNAMKVSFAYDTNTGLSDWQRTLETIIVEDLITTDKITYTLVNSIYPGDNKRIKLDGIKEKFNSGTDSYIYEFSYNSQTLPARNSNMQDIFGYFNNAISNSSLIVLDSNGDPVSNRQVNETYIKAGILEEIEFSTGGSRKYYYEANKDGNNIGPGLRLLRVIDYDNDGTTILGSKNFLYYNLSGKYFDQTNFSNQDFTSLSPTTQNTSICKADEYLSYNYSKNKLNEGFYYDSIRMVHTGQNSPIYETPAITYHYNGKLVDNKYIPYISRVDYYTATLQNVFQMTMSLEKVKSEYYTYSNPTYSTISDVKIYNVISISNSGSWISEFFTTSDSWKYSTDRINLISKRTSTFYGTDSLSILEEFQYNSKQLLKRHKVTNSAGKEKYTYYNYPFDISNNSTFTAMTTNYLFDHIVEEVNVYDSKVISNQLTTYASFSGKYLPNKLYTRKISDLDYSSFQFFSGSTVSSDFINTEDIQTYDSYGNPKKIVSASGITTEYTWSTYGRFPLSKKISGGSLSQTEYYTWDNMSGIKTYKDPTGIQTNYYYSNGALTQIKNNELETLKEFENHSKE